MFSNREARHWVWLVAGTGEGPAAAALLLELGVAVGVQVVTARACRAYGHLAHQAHQAPLRCAAGAVDGAAVRAVLLGSSDGRRVPPFLVVDATHPFAQRITGTLQEACQACGIPCLRLLRPLLDPGRAVLIEQLEELRQPQLADRQLLAAVGARDLPRLMAFRRASCTAARVLPTASALRQATAAGLPPHRIALLQPAAAIRPPDPLASVEAALCRHWNIRIVVARQSGGRTEQRWQEACAALGIALWLLRRPGETGTWACTVAMGNLQARVREQLATLPDHPVATHPPLLP